MEQQKFIETVELLKQKAENNGNKITRKEIDDMFTSDELHLDDSQLKMVYAYLKTSRIEITDEEEEEQTEEETASDEEYEDKDMEFVRMYQADIKNVKILSQEELTEAMKEPKKYHEQIIGTFLKDVIKWVKNYAGGSVFMSDLIQEGNLGLMEGVNTFDYEGALAEVSDNKDIAEREAAVKKLRSHLKKSVVRAVQAAVCQQESEDNVGYKIAGRVNAVNDCARELAEEMGRKVTIEELSEKLGMTYEEVKEIVDLSSDKIEYIC